MPETILHISNLSKSYSGIKALDNVQLTIARGEVHALMGENGAGKSTLMKILAGLIQPDSGEIVFEGNVLKNNKIKELQKKGISMIHQEILIIPELTVAQNIFLGREKEAGTFSSWWVNDQEISQKATAILRDMSVNIDAEAPMKYLSVAQMQMVEIAKAVSNNAKVIIMDEPTSAISDKEVDTLFAIIKDLKSKGVSVIYISHKMGEIFEIADTITVLRDGKYISTKSAVALDRNSLIAMMVGREMDTMFPESESKIGDVVIEVKGLTKKNKFSDINFKVHAGEILGISGLMGAGRTEIARVIYGLDSADEGSIYLNNELVSPKSPREAVEAGIGYVSEDRKGLGFIPHLSVKENLTLTSLSEHCKGVFIEDTSERAAAGRMVSDLKIKISGTNQKVVHLSGGNQQKVVIGRVLLANPKVVILDEPTRGVDVGAKFEIYKLINNLAEKGIAIIMISSELPEILGMCDRIMVLSKGTQTAVLTRDEANQETIMKYAVQ